MKEETKKTKTFASIFGDDFDGFEEESSMQTLKVETLIHFKDHPFKLYEGERQSAMVDSIKHHGVLVPIVVRKKGLRYEILSGHNRVEACKLLNIESIPVVIKEGLTDDEAMLIVTETNTMQRSITELPHSERATIISVRHKAMKNQGVRNDLLEEIERLSKAPTLNDDVTCAPLGHKLKSRDKVGIEYGMSKNTVARYLRVSKLPQPFKKLIDEGQIAIRAGVDLSYLREDSLDIVHAIITEDHYKIDMKRARDLKVADKKAPLSFKKASDIIKGEKKEKKKVIKAPKYWTTLYSKYFKNTQKEEEVSQIIDQALSMYYASISETSHEDEREDEEIGL